MSTNGAWDKTREQTFEETSQTERGPGTTGAQGALRGNPRNVHGAPPGSSEMSGNEQGQGSGSTALADAPIEGQTTLSGDADKLGQTAKGQTMKSDSIAGSVVDAPGESGQ